MNSSENILRRLAAAAAVVATLLVFGASGAQAASTHAVAVSVSFAAQDDEPSDEESEDPSDEEDSEDSDDEDSDDEDSDSDESTDEPTDEPTFTDPPTTDTTDNITEMPTDDAGTTSEAGAPPLGWILLGGGVACAAAAIAVYRRNRSF